MNPELGRQIARQIESQQVALLRQESARRRQLASPRAQVLTYRDGAVYNQGSNGSLTPTRLITNRGIPEGGSVARKGGGASDASPFYRQRNVGSSQGLVRQKRYAIKFRVDIINAILSDGNYLFDPLILKSNEVTLPINSAEERYTRGRRDVVPMEDATFSRLPAADDYLGGRLRIEANYTDSDLGVYDRIFECGVANTSNSPLGNGAGINFFGIQTIFPVTFSYDISVFGVPTEKFSITSEQPGNNPITVNAIGDNDRQFVGFFIVGEIISRNL